MSVRCTTDMCSFPGCENKRRHHSSLCNGHRNQKETGKELTQLYLKCRKAGTPPRIKYEEKECPNKTLEGPCHIFSGAIDGMGYGSVGLKGDKTITVHRYVWITENGPVPNGLELDHMCRVKSCCNLKHLRAVTHRINSIENCDGPSAINARKTHCKYGHQFTPENTYLTKEKTRKCKTCVKRQSRQLHERRMLAKNKTT